MLVKNNIGIIAIISVFLLANLTIIYFYNDLWWDSSVYIGMGKYIFSFGESGLWEESRPLILPVILGVGWFLDLDIVYFGRLVSIIFAVLVVYLTYIIGIKLFSKKIALLAAFFTAFSYNFLFFSPSILTGIPSTFCVLLAFYFFLSNRFFLMGMFSGISVMTRFFQAFTLIGFGLVFLIHFSRKPNFTKKLIYAVEGISIIILPYLLFNSYVYDDISLPFKVQTHLTKTTGWTQYQESDFYFTGLFKENFFLVFLFFLPLFFKKNYKIFALILIPLIYVLIFSFVRHKEMRFMLVILPFLYLLTSFCIFQIYDKLKNKKITLGLFFVAAVIWLGISFTTLIGAVSHSQDSEGLLFMQDYLKTDRGKVWITNPLYALHSDQKIEGLLYFYSSENLIKFINENKETVDTVLFNNCDIPCAPQELDPLCSESRKVLSNALSDFNKIYQKEINLCKYLIFTRHIS